MLPAFSVLSFLAIVFPNSYVYLEGWTEVFQAIALYAFHMLLIDFVAPTERKRDEFFGKLKVKKIFRKNQYREGISWLKVGSDFHLLRYHADNGACDSLATIPHYNTPLLSSGSLFFSVLPRPLIGTVLSPISRLLLTSG